MRASKIKRFFDLQERRTKLAEELSREVVRLSSRGVMAIHRHGDANALLQAARRTLRKLEKLSIPVSSGTLVSAQQEFGEFFVLKFILEKERIPEPEEVGIPYYPYLMALADVGGELRRALLESLRRRDFRRAEKLLQHMEEIFELLSDFDHPERILPGLRRKRDILGRILERSRGDLTLVTLRR
jgi:translin